mgnify:CR=1 FL=1
MCAMWVEYSNDIEVLTNVHVTREALDGLNFQTQKSNFEVAEVFDSNKVLLDKK